MKTKFYIFLLSGLFSIKSNAQEQFLKLDSIQIVQGEHYIDITLNSGTLNLSVLDTINCPNGGLIKVKNVVLEIESKGASFQNNHTLAYYGCIINGIGVASLLNHSNDPSPLWGGQVKRMFGIEQVDLMYNSDLFINIKSMGNAGSYNSSYDVDYRYRIELHHYSYE